MRHPGVLQKHEGFRSKSHWTFHFHFLDLLGLPDATTERLDEKRVIPLRTILQINLDHEQAKK